MSLIKKSHFIVTQNITWIRKGRDRFSPFLKNYLYNLKPL